MAKFSTDRIEKQIDLKAPVARVWRALTDHREFGEWFRVKLETPFLVDQISRGRITYPGYEHMTMELVVKKIEPQRLFAYSWHPYAVDPNIDYSNEPSTLVEFVLEEIASGTRLRVTESGFDALPPVRRMEAFRMNENGWQQQMLNIANHVGQNR